MKENFVKIVFVIDESGSMCSSKKDVIGGFNSFIDDQKAENKGDVNVSLYTFSNDVKNVFSNVNINEVKYLEDYYPGGSTALNDAVGTAITNTGKELSDMEESERPSTVMFVIMTDGEENCSREFRSVRVREMIQHQAEKYNWKFIYLGTDITTTKMADDLGIKCRAFSSRSNISDTMRQMSKSTTLYRCASTEVANELLSNTLDDITSKYETEIGVKIEK